MLAPLQFLVAKARNISTRHRGLIPIADNKTDQPDDAN